MTKALETSVLIVGAGPVGLALAAELGWRGVSALVIDEGQGEIVFPAGEAIGTRTMEHLRRWGIASEARSDRFPQERPRDIVFATRLGGHEITRIARPSNAEAGRLAGDLSPESDIWCPKMWFDPVLRTHAKSYAHVEIRDRCRLESFTQDANGIRAAATDLDTEERIEIEASYIVGCDGARSAVRRTLGLRYEGIFAEGHNFGIYLRAPGLQERLPGGPMSHVYTLATKRAGVLSAVDGESLWRLNVAIGADETDVDPAGCVADALGAEIEMEILRAQPWGGHRVVTDRYRVDRAFLAGDSAHLLWPAGGFGANTGIGDAVDLGWKLAAVLAGWGGDALLDSYEAERRPIAVRNVEEAASNMAAAKGLPRIPALEEDSEAGEAARARLAGAIRTSRSKEWRSLGVQLGYRYAASPIVVADGTPEPADDPTDYVPTTWPGSRAPHHWVTAGRSTLDLFGQGFVLVAQAAADVAGWADAAAGRGMPLAIHRHADAALAALYEQPLVLVRPDGHVAWRGAGADPDAILAQASGTNGTADAAAR